MSKHRTLIVYLVVVAMSAAALLFCKPPEYNYQDHHDVEPGMVGASERSSQWPKVRNAYLNRNPACEACGSKRDLNVHHIVPFHTDPSLELEYSNLITLCREHHLSIGHCCDSGGRNWSCRNPNVREDAKELRRNLEYKNSGIPIGAL